MSDEREKDGVIATASDNDKTGKDDKKDYEDIAIYAAVQRVKQER